MNSVLQENKVKVSVKYEGVVEDTFSRKVLFSITTKENMAEFVKFRSSLDFIHLRSQMLKKWVFFYIPNFPKLQISFLSQISESSITRKTRYLQQFLAACVDSPEISSCSDLQIFLKGPENYTENSKQLPLDYREVLAKMTYRSRDLPEISYDSSAVKTEAETIRSTLAELKDLKKKFKALSNAFDAIQETQRLMIVQYERVGSVYISKLGNAENFGIDPFGSESNIYTNVLRWVTNEIYSLRSAFEEIEKFWELEKNLEKIEKKISKKKDDVRVLESGKRPISAIFNVKGSAEIMIKVADEVRVLETQSRSMGMLLRMLYLHLTTKTLPEMAAEKMKRYCDCLELFSLDTIACFSPTVN